MKHKKYCKVRDHCHYTREYRGAVHSMCNLKYSVPKKIPIDCHFIIKELSEKNNLIVFWENTEKYITFTVAIENRIYKN